MAWTIDYTASAKRELKKFDRPQAKRIIDYMNQRIAVLEDPRSTGKALTGPMGEYWRYRVGDHRVICEIQDKTLVVLVVRIGSRRDVYE